MSDDQFSLYWHERHKGGASDAMLAKTRSLASPAPHGISLEAGELLLAAWVGNDQSAPDRLVPLLAECAKRIVANKSKPTDSFEKEFWEKAHPSVSLEAVDEESDDGEMNDVEENQSIGGSPVSCVRIQLVGSLSKIEDYLTQYICMTDGASVPVHSPVLVDPRIAEFGLKVNLSVQDRLPTGYSTGTKNHLTMAIVRFGDLCNLIQYGNAIFEENVRGFLGFSSVTNTRLKKSYEEVAGGSQTGSNIADMFPLLNNGITICHTGYLEEKNVISLVNPQVINGQQTLRTWDGVYADEKDEDARERLRDIRVVVRIVRLFKSGDAKRIAFANNRQNAVSSIDLRSNEQSLKVIEECFSEATTKYGFRRKFGAGVWSSKKNSLDADDIYKLLCKINDKKPESEDFFDSEESFQSFFTSIAARLRDQKKVHRLIGLHIFSSVTAGKKRRQAIRELLKYFGLHAGSMGKGDDGDRRLLTYALWPMIHKCILHALLGKPSWKGIDSPITTIFTQENIGGPRQKIWVPSGELRELVIEAGIKLPKDLVSKIYDDYDEWKKRKAELDPEADNDPESFVKENVTQERMFELTEIPKADLLRDL